MYRLRLLSISLCQCLVLIQIFFKLYKICRRGENEVAKAFALCYDKYRFANEVSYLET